MSPPSIIYEDKKGDDLLRRCLHKDIAWMLTSVVELQLNKAKNLKPLGSWVALMKQITQHETMRAVLDYLPVLSSTPGDMQMVHDLESDCNFFHEYQAVYCKMMIIKWLNKGQQDKITPLLGGFHALLMKSKFLHKKFGVLGLK